MRVLVVALQLLLAENYEALIKEPEWSETSPTKTTGNKHDNVAFYMERKYHPNEPQLVNMTCTFSPEMKHVQIMTLWITPYKKEAGFYFHFSHKTFQEHIAYIGDKELIELGFLVFDLTADKVGKYTVELKYDNGATLTHSVNIKLSGDVDVTTITSITSTKYMEGDTAPLTKLMIVVIVLICALFVGVPLVAVIYVVTKRRGVARKGDTSARNNEVENATLTPTDEYVDV